MLADQLAAAISTASSFKHLDNLARLVWRGWGEGHLDDGTAKALGEAVEARKALIRGKDSIPAARRPGESPSPSQRPPDRQRSIMRRRRLAGSGAVPGRIAADFTTGKTAVLSVIAQEAKRSGSCLLPVGKLAALAGCCRTLVQDALREARALGLIDVQERRRRGQRSLTNIVRIVSAKWQAWLGLRGWVQKNEHHAVTQKKPSETGTDRHPAPASRQPAGKKGLQPMPEARALSTGRV